MTHLLVGDQNNFSCPTQSASSDSLLSSDTETSPGSASPGSAYPKTASRKEIRYEPSSGVVNSTNSVDTDLTLPNEAEPNSQEPQQIFNREESLSHFRSILKAASLDIFMYRSLRAMDQPFADFALGHEIDKCGLCRELFAVSPELITPIDALSD
jgi:hypothetical protein